MKNLHLNTCLGWLDYIASKRETVILHLPLPVMRVFGLKVCLESDETRVHGIDLSKHVTVTVWALSLPTPFLTCGGL